MKLFRGLFLSTLVFICCIQLSTAQMGAAWLKFILKTVHNTFGEEMVEISQSNLADLRTRAAKFDENQGFFEELLKITSSIIVNDQLQHEESVLSVSDLKTDMSNLQIDLTSLLHETRNGNQFIVDVITKLEKGATHGFVVLENAMLDTEWTDIHHKTKMYTSVFQDTIKNETEKDALIRNERELLQTRIGNDESDSDSFSLTQFYMLTEYWKTRSLKKTSNYPALIYDLLAYLSMFDLLAPLEKQNENAEKEFNSRMSNFQLYALRIMATKAKAMWVNGACTTFYGDVYSGFCTDPCTVKNGGCDQSVSCINDNGNAICQCEANFQLSNGVCKDCPFQAALHRIERANGFVINVNDEESNHSDNEFYTITKESGSSSGSIFLTTFWGKEYNLGSYNESASSFFDANGTQNAKRLIYSGGDSCNDLEVMTSEVRVTCAKSNIGAKFEITSVSKPSPCNYLFTVQIACCDIMSTCPLAEALSRLEQGNDLIKLKESENSVTHITEHSIVERNELKTPRGTKTTENISLGTYSGTDGSSFFYTNGDYCSSIEDYRKTEIQFQCGDSTSYGDGIVENGFKVISMTEPSICNHLFVIQIPCCHIVSASPTGEWTNWGEWSACGATCGESTKTRHRTCSKGLGQLDCIGNDTETTKCTVDPCPNVCISNGKNMLATFKGRNVAFGCHKGRCWSYCGRSWTFGEWCWTKGSRAGHSYGERLSCSSDEDCCAQYGYEKCGRNCSIF